MAAGVPRLRRDMGQTILAAVGSGLAVAGVLATGGALAARCGERLPHLGVTALGAGAAAVATRLVAVPVPLTVLAVAAAGAVAGSVGWAADRAVRRAGGRELPLLPEVAVLGVAIAMLTLLRAPTAVELPLGPLGGLASTAAGVVAAVAGAAGALVFATRLGPAWVWTAGCALVAVVVAVGGGAVTVLGDRLMPAFGLPDVVGLALRAAAVGVVSRSGIGALLAAAFSLGLGEALLRSFALAGEVAVVPALVLLAAGLAARARTPVPAP